MNLTIEMANTIIRNLKNRQRSFDSHDFINEYKNLFLNDYFIDLNHYRNDETTLHRVIGRFLSRKQRELGISKTPNKVKTMNCHNNETDCAKWE